MLSKSLYVAGTQCLRQLWWRVHEPRAVELQPDIVLEDRFDQGNQVGALARDRFPGGVLIESAGPWADRVARTRAALDAGVDVVFEAAFVADGVRVACDVLRRTGSGHALIEVKSSSSCKPEQIPDAAIQTWVLARSGIHLSRVEVMHLNREFRHPDVGDLFARTDVTEDVLGRLAMIPGDIEVQQAAIAGPLPEVKIGAHCDTPWGCPFKARCWPDDPHHISRLYRVGPQRAASYMQQGIQRIDDLPPKTRLEPAQRRQVRALGERRMIVEPGLDRALAPFAVEPLGFLDFETVARAVPVWPAMKPWENAAAQFSYHETVPGGGHRHVEHLAEGAQDARPEVARRLVEATRGAAGVVTYTSFEKTQIRALATAVPEYAAELGALEARLLDLHPVVRDHVYHPAFTGSFSLKSVLTPLVPELTYDDLVIVDGLAASVQIARLLFVAGRIAPEERPRVRQDLLDYCRMDTWATVRLLEVLRGLACG